MTFSSILALAIGIAISFLGFGLHAVYKTITRDLRETDRFYRLGKVTLLFAFLGMFAAWLTIINVSLDFPLDLGLIPFYVFCTSIAINLLLIIATPLNKQCRYRIADLARHRNSKIAFAFLVTLLGVLWMIAKIVAKFFYHAFKGSRSSYSNYSGPNSPWEEQADIESGAIDEPIGYYDLNGRYKK